MDKLPKGWSVFKFDDVCSRITDGSHFSPKTIDNGFPYVTVKDISNSGEIDVKNCKKISEKAFIELAKSNCRPNIGDVLLSKDGTVGKTALVNKNEKFVVLSSLAILSPKPSIVHSKFLYLFLNSPDFQEKAISSKTGAAIKRIVLKNIKEFEIPVPPLSEQTQIVSTLDALFTRIDKSIILLEENIKHTKGLMASVLEELFHSSSKQIALSEIVVKTMNINPLVNPETQFTYIDITSVNNQLHRIENPKTIQGKDAPSRAKKSVMVGDIVFATTRPNLKNIAIVNKDFSNPVASTGFCVLRTKKGISNEFLFLCLLSNNIQDQINPFIRGAQYPAISDKDLLKCKVPDLPIIQQMEIANKVIHLRNKLSYISVELQSKLTYLKALKSSILDRAFKGEL